MGCLCQKIIPFAEFLEVSMPLSLVGVSTGGGRGGVVLGIVRIVNTVHCHLFQSENQIIHLASAVSWATAFKFQWDQVKK